MNSLEIANADLHSSMQALVESHKRLRSRIGMQELRERVKTSAATGDAPPPGASKQELRDYYLRGKTSKQLAMSAIEEREQ